MRELPIIPGGSVDALDVIEPPTAPGGSVEALDCVGEGDGDAGDDDIAVTGNAGAGAGGVDTVVTCNDVAGVGDGDAAGDVDTVVTGIVVVGVGDVGATSTDSAVAVLSSGVSSLLLGRRRCREASGTGVDVVGVVDTASGRGVAVGSPGLPSRRRRGA